MNLLFLSDIYHKLKHRFSRHTDEAVFKTEHFLSITAEDSSLIATVGLLPKLYLTGDSIADLPFQIIKVLNNLPLADESAKSVGAMAIREMKMIPDEVCVVGLALLGLRISIEVGDCHGIGVQSPQRNVFLFQGAVCGLFTCIYAHDYYLRCYAVKALANSHHGSRLTYDNRSTPNLFNLSLVFIWSLKLQNRSKPKIKEKNEVNTLKVL